MTRHIALVLGLLCVALAGGCTSTKDYEARLENWVGKSERELVMSWGIPDKQYQLDPRTRLLSYVNRDTVYYPGSFSTCVGGFHNHFGLSNCGGFPPTAQTLHCETLFTLVNGRVTKWGHRGNNCRE
jgi:hypothetical protein